MERREASGPLAGAKNAALRVLTAPARRRNYWSERMANFCTHYLRVYENFNWEFESNGESEVLKRLSPRTIRVVFDIGAHEGTWSDLALRCFPEAVVHAFEVAHPTAQALQERFHQERRIVVNPIGLGDNSRAIRIAYFPEHRDNTVVLADGQAPPSDAMQLHGAVTAGDAYCKEHAIGHIDYCKIDVEGYEYFVLKGFERMLSRRAIDAIQFEHVAASNLRSSHCLEDIFSLLASCRYRIGRLFPHGALPQAYESKLEFLGYANFIAITDERSDLWESLSYR